jgi:3-deoxy-manno-octulosonate cytidylyltransferase (CMP-KDO synthetase)
VKATAVIPARYASKRLPGKALLSETGKSLIVHVMESIRPAKRVERIVVATDDERIVRAVESAGGEAVMTSADCRTGTDRVAEAAGMLGLPNEAVVVNVQGDEPEFPPSCVDAVVELLEGSDAPMATLATPMAPQEAEQLNLTKVVRDRDGHALYFSRVRIPHDRDGEGGVEYLLHHGVYAYRAGFLRMFAALESTPAERAEKLEQLRALEHGHRIAVGVVDYRGARIDTPAEYAAFVARFSP